MEFVNSFSVWVIVGSAINYMFFCELFQVPIQVSVVLCLSLSVWIIYTLDHIVDGFKLKANSLSLRHQIHYHYSKPLLFLIVAAALLVLVLVIWFLEARVKLFGISIAAVLLLYFAFNRWLLKSNKRNLPIKELGIAVVVSLCLAGLAVFQSGRDINLDVYSLILPFFLINWGNLLLFSYYDYEPDMQANFSSIGNYLSAKSLRNLDLMLLLANAVLILLAFWMGGHTLKVYGLLMLMNAQLILILLFPKHFSKNESFRFWGDIIYIYPLLYFLLP